MVFLTANAVNEAVAILRSDVHPFFGITFVACKAAELPVGRQVSISLDAETRQLLEKAFRIDKASAYFFQPFKSVKSWVDRKYPSSGLQAINTQTFGEAFLHKRGTQLWGWDEQYVEKISNKLSDLGYLHRSPLAAMAVWYLKFEAWPENATISDVISEFVRRYHLTDFERQILFYDDSERFGDRYIFQPKRLESDELAALFEPPPDAPATVGGTLVGLHLEFVGPALSMELEFGKRLTIITGDNGLGKSFLLEAAWWAATGEWAERQAFPFFAEDNVPVTDVTPNISYWIEDNRGRSSRRQSNFDWRQNQWSSDEAHLTLSALAIFARADGSFAVSDPVRNSLERGRSTGIDQFSQRDLWDGMLGGQGIEGIIRDWTRWQKADDQQDFTLFSAILAHLSPEDLGVLRPGRAIRIPGSDKRDIPTIRHRYGETPILFASAGVKRVIGLAYLMVWALRENRVAATQSGSHAYDKLLVFIDEIEAHLHPKWQRSVLPAIVNMNDALNTKIGLQIVSATHSPMIMASLEPLFDDTTDKIFHLALADNNVELKPLEFVKYGDATGWLTSPLFGLEYARSRDAEKAISRAKELQIAEKPSAADVKAANVALRKALAPDDKFWPRWLYFAQKHGAEI